MAYTTIDKPKEYHSTTLWTADERDNLFNLKFFSLWYPEFVNNFLPLEINSNDNAPAW